MNFSFYFGLRSYTRLTFVHFIARVSQSMTKTYTPEPIYSPISWGTYRGNRSSYFNYTTSPIFDVDLGALFRGLYPLDRSSVFIIVPLLTVMGCTDPPSLLGARRPVPRDKAFVTLTRRWTAGEDSINALIFMSCCTKPRVVYLSIGQRLVTWALCAFTITREL